MHSKSEGSVFDLTKKIFLKILRDDNRFLLEIFSHVQVMATFEDGRGLLSICKFPKPTGDLKLCNLAMPTHFAEYFLPPKF